MPRLPLVHASIVVTPAGDNAEFVFGCLGSLCDSAPARGFGLLLTVVINGDGADLSPRLRERYPGIDLIHNAHARGLAANHNATLAGSEADYFLIANDDVVFRPGALERAVGFLRDPANARVACVGFNLLNPDGSLQPSTYAFPTVPRALLDQSGLRGWVPFAPWTSRLAAWVGRGAGRSRFWAHDRTVAVDTFKSAVMLVRAAAAREIGPLDETTLIGGDETDWHKRMWDAGWSVVFLHDAQVVHFGSQTLRRLPQLHAEFLKGTLNFFWKHRPRPWYFAVCMLAIPLLTLRIGLAFVTGAKPDAEVLLRSLRTAIRWGFRGPRL